MFVDERGAVQALAIADSRLRRARATACGEPLELLPDAVSVNDSRGEPVELLVGDVANATVLGFAGSPEGDEILLDLFAMDLGVVVASAASGATRFVLGPSLASGHFSGSASRLDDDWVASTFDSGGAIRLFTVGDASSFASVARSQTPGAWISELPGTLVWLEDTSPDRIDGVWVRNTHVADRQLGGVVASRVTVVRRPE
jgi:hypothetical protein